MGSSEGPAASSSKSGRLSVPGRFPAGQSRSHAAIDPDGRGQSAHLLGVVGIGIQSDAGMAMAHPLCLRGT